MTPVFDLAVVGAGPAGIEAALTALEHGLQVIVFDEQQRVGGQIFRQPPSEFTGARSSFSAAYPWAERLLRRAEQSDAIDWRFGTTVFGVLHDDPEPASDRPAGRFHVMIATGGAPEVICAKQVLIATGAYDMPVALPGWTLPGVMTVGGAQSLVKSQKVLPGQRILLAGSHPLLILAAEQLRRAGATIVEVAVARAVPRLREALAALPAVGGHTRLMRESASALLALRRAGVRLTTRHTVTRILGDERVTSVDLAPVDAAWRVTGTARNIPVDLVLLGFGFLPCTELARQLRCELVWDSPKGGWVVAHDALMRTSVDGVYVAGEPGGVAGADQARAQGRLAGLAVATGLNRTSPQLRASLRTAQAQVRRAARFSSVVQRLFEPKRSALIDLITRDTELCRCELVTGAELCGVLAEHPFISSANAAKLHCRPGMGACQGRYCESSVAGLVAATRGIARAQVGFYSAHVPVRPVPLQTLAEMNRFGAADHPDRGT